MFDDGAMASFITQELAEKLEVPVRSKKMMEVSHFGTLKNTGRMQTNEREVCLKGTYPGAEEAMLPVHDTTHIVQMPGLAVTEFATELKKDGCWLADERLLKTSGRHPFKIDILIGADYIWNLATTTFICSGTGYKAHLTTFGWAIVGSRVTSNSTRHSPVVAAMLTCCAVKKIAFSSELEEEDDAVAAEKNFQVVTASVGAAVEEVTEETYDKAGVRNGLNAAKTPELSVQKIPIAAETAASSGRE